MTKQENIAIGLLVVGLLGGIASLLGDIAGGPSYLHVFTWVAGFAFGYGLVTFIRSNLRRRR